MSIDDHDPLEAFVVTRKIDHTIDAANDAVVVALETSTGVIMLRLSEEVAESLGETLIDLASDMAEAKDELEFQRDIDEANADIDDESDDLRFGEDDYNEEAYLTENGVVRRRRVYGASTDHDDADAYLHDDPSQRAFDAWHGALHQASPSQRAVDAREGAMHQSSSPRQVSKKPRSANAMARRQAFAMVTLALFLAGAVATSIVMVG